MLIPENVIRKLDSLGRITLPKGLRDRMFLGESAELEIYTANIDGRICICLATPETKEGAIQEAKERLGKYGVKIQVLEES